jgi:hypothetical protein
MAEVAFSGHQNTENEFTGSFVPLNCGFHDSAEIAFSGHQNVGN